MLPIIREPSPKAAASSTDSVHAPDLKIRGLHTVRPFFGNEIEHDHRGLFEWILIWNPVRMS